MLGIWGAGPLLPAPAASFAASASRADTASTFAASTPSTRRALSATKRATSSTCARGTPDQARTALQMQALPHILRVIDML